MNRISSTIVSISIFAFAALGQAAAPRHDGPTQDSLPAVEEQMKVLTGKLDLTAEQRSRIKPIMQQLHRATLRIMREQGWSREERLAKVRPHRLLADEKIRAILTAEQKKRLDAYEAGPHPEMHGTLTGTPNAPVQ